MLDFLTLFSTVSLQQEMGASNFGEKANLVIREEERGEGNLAEEAAEHLSSVFESFEGALSTGLGSLLGAGEEPVMAKPAKKVE
mmetsp:Transcript_104719/g.312805  ORF Transcript_104719/g.312805 Transcript_104719/m.312805 type:complete len:84 (-) Transcript_104719:88-339(-)